MTGPSPAAQFCFQHSSTILGQRGGRSQDHAFMGPQQPHQTILVFLLAVHVVLLHRPEGAIVRYFLREGVPKRAVLLLSFSEVHKKQTPSILLPLVYTNHCSRQLVHTRFGVAVKTK